MRKLSRTSSSRLSLLRSLTRNLVEQEAIETSQARAKEAARFIDKVVKTLRKGDVAARRRAQALLADKEVEKKLFERILPRFSKRKSGFTKLTRLGRRRGDAAMMVKLEWSEGRKEEKKKEKKKSSKEKKAKGSHAHH